jgi:cell division protein FtsB
MAGKKHADKKPRPKASLLTKLVILMLLAAIGWKVYDLRGQLQAAQAEKEAYALQVEEQQQKNDALAADIAEGPTAEKIEEIARNELGYVKSGEYVFEPRD